MTTSGDSNSSDDLKTSMSMVRDAQAQDPDAWLRLVTIYTPLIRLWCITKGIRGHDIADCCQEVFMRASGRLPYFVKKNPKDSFRGWLRKITHVVVANYLRAKYKNVQIVPGGSSAYEAFVAVPDANSKDSISSQIARTERHLLAKRVMDVIQKDFPSRQTKAFVNVVMYERRPRDVAEDLGTSVNFVYKAKCRILAKIRKLFPVTAA
jgi:RNA polymerase sigma-70 factor (ECF subfamily)